MISDLTSKALSSRALTFFAIGGSGIRVLQPLLHLCALGLGPRQLNMVMIDPDQSNDAVTRARELLDLYRKTREGLTAGHGPGDGYFRTEVNDAVATVPIWSPIADDEHLQNAAFGVRVDRPVMKGNELALAQVFDLLFSKRHETMDLTLGFRGVPSIGTIFMNRLRDEPFFEQLLVNGQTDAESTYFAAGSIFGGTGAAGLPVVGRLLLNGVKGVTGRSDVRGIPKRRLGAALLMPYFTLPAPSTRDAPDGGIRPEAALFAQNTAAAIPSYTDDQAGFGSYYMIGDSEPREQDQNEVGGAAQANRSHYVEFYSALAALDFAARAGEQAQEQLPVFRATGVDANNAKWSDLPIDENSRRRLLGGLVAVHTYLVHFRPDGRSHPDLERAVRGATWLGELGLTSKQFQERSNAHDLLGQFFRRTWDWASELGASTPAMQLIRSQGRRAPDVQSHESIDGRRAATGLPATSHNAREVFRAWNVASSRLKRAGHGGFLETMRLGSEAFAAERFPETVSE